MKTSLLFAQNCKFERGLPLFARWRDIDPKVAPHISAICGASPSLVMPPVDVFQLCEIKRDTHLKEVLHKFLQRAAICKAEFEEGPAEQNCPMENIECHTLSDICNYCTLQLEI